MTSDERTVQHYLQLAHNRGGGWQMAMLMMARELEYAYEGRRGPNAEPEQQENGDDHREHL